MKILIIIPAYNEAKNLPIVMNSLLEFPEYDYIIINDGSKDNTVDLCNKNGWKMLDLPVNLGLSAAIQTGMRYAKMYDYDYAIQIDGDGQHRPEYISTMIDVIPKADIIIGSRFLTKKMRIGMRTIGSILIKLALLVTTGKKIMDPTSGMRLYNRKMIFVLAEAIDFGPEPDTLAYFIRNGAKVCETAVKMDERISGDSYLSASQAIMYMIRMFLSIGIFQYIRKKIDLEAI